MNKRKKLIAVFVLIAAAGLAFYVFSKPASAPEVASPESEMPPSEAPLPEKPPAPTVPPPPAEAALPKGFRLYKNSEFGFEIQYPETWTAAEEDIENVRGEKTKGFFFKKPQSDLRFAILPRDGFSYGLPASEARTSEVYIGGSLGVQSKWTTGDGRRLWLVHPQYGLHNWSQDIGRIDAMTSKEDPEGDTVIFEQMFNSFKFIK